MVNGGRRGINGPWGRRGINSPWGEKRGGINDLWGEERLQWSMGHQWSMEGGGASMVHGGKRGTNGP